MDPKTLKVADLKVELKKLGLDASGAWSCGRVVAAVHAPLAVSQCRTNLALTSRPFSSCHAQCTHAGLKADLVARLTDALASAGGVEEQAGSAPAEETPGEAPEAPAAVEVAAPPAEEPASAAAPEAPSEAAAPAAAAETTAETAAETPAVETALSAEEEKKKKRVERFGGTYKPPAPSETVRTSRLCLG
eukprot:SAG11_NODE_4104_length_2063_cov_1.708248_3_plen_190_part_00